MNRNSRISKFKFGHAWQWLSSRDSRLQKGMSVLIVAMAIVTLVGTAITVGTLNTQMSAKTASQLRLSLESYSIMEQISLRVIDGLVYRNNPWFMVPSANGCPAGSTRLNNPYIPEPFGTFICSYPANPCGAGTTSINLTGPASKGFGLCLANDLDNVTGNGNLCIRSSSGSDFCLDFPPPLRAELDPHSKKGTLPTLEFSFSEKVSWYKKWVDESLALYTQTFSKISQQLEPLNKAYAQASQITARPTAPNINATTNLANVPTCPNNNGGPEYCVRCTDSSPEIFCAQIVVCMPPGCAGGGQQLYQRIAWLRSRPMP
ncbi:MAG: hypothetical protein KDD35_12175 [Bdellovibrionales bacterium]|nr:hypothetical protein [Bdellovibrionales bacterium]